jgi:hypothetical protein
MKVIMKFKLTLFIAMSISIMAQATSIGKQDFSKDIHKEFSVDSDATIDLMNKYGNVNIETTSGSQVVIDVRILVEASNQDKANDIFDRINIDFSNSSQYVKAETNISTKNTGWFKRWWNGGSKNSFKIHYVVKMPESCELKLSNKYGDSFVGDLGNRATVVIKYGAIEMKNVDGLLNLEVKYGKGSIGMAKDVDLILGYSKFNMESTDDLDLSLSYSTLNLSQAATVDAEMKYSNLRIENADLISMDSKYDDIEIENTDEVQLDSKYTSVDIQNLHGKGSFDMGYGGLKVRNLVSSFQSMNIETNYTGVKIYIDDRTEFVLDAVTEYASVKAPDLNTTIDIRKNNSTTLKGYYGSQNAGKIVARMKYGSLSIQ